MKNKTISLLCAAALLLSGCQSSQSAESSINIINAGTAESVPQSSIPQESSPALSGESLSSRDDEPTPVESTEVVTTSPEQLQPQDSTNASAQTPAENTTVSTTAVTTPAASTTTESTTASTTAATSQTTTQTSTEASTTPDTASSVPDTAEDITQPVEIEYTANVYSALNYSEVRGIWISYIELAELLRGKTAEQFKANIGQAFDNCAALGLNTVYIHARSHGDAYYQSSLFPQSKYVTGTYGKSADFDPLEIMVEQAHARGLSIHAWINPLRCCALSEISGAQGTRIYEWANNSATAGKYIVNVNGTYYLNPAYTEVIDTIAAGAAEIVANYDVDGVHIDDYFYPTTNADFDSAAFAQSGYDTLSAFRFANCDKLVSGLYSAVKAANSTALFGVSCQGSLENNYNLMYADVKKWIANDGYLDYIMPQIYYGFDNSSQPYEKCTSEWNELSTAGGKPLIVGLSVSKIGAEDEWAGAGKYEWINDKKILSRQFAFAAEMQAYGGACLYSYKSVFWADSAVESQVVEEINALKALFN